MRIYPICILLCLSILACRQPKEESINISFIFVSDKAKSVYLTGSFNNWSADSLPLIKENKQWVISVKLKPGYYYYKFVVDGEWIPDPKNGWKINDGGTGYNSIIKVGNPVRPVRKKSVYPFPKDKLPQPILTQNEQ